MAQHKRTSTRKQSKMPQFDNTGQQSALTAAASGSTLPVVLSSCCHAHESRVPTPPPRQRRSTTMRPWLKQSGTGPNAYQPPTGLRVLIQQEPGVARKVQLEEGDARQSQSTVEVITQAELAQQPAKSEWQEQHREGEEEEEEEEEALLTPDQVQKSCKRVESCASIHSDGGWTQIQQDNPSASPSPPPSTPVPQPPPRMHQLLTSNSSCTKKDTDDPSDTATKDTIP